MGAAGWQLVVDYVENKQRSEPLFAYSYVDDSGKIPSPLPTQVAGDMTNRIVNIQIRLVVDLNPGHAPTPMTLTTTVQPRNLRST